MYMVHGGTNFGLTAGGNDNSGVPVYDLTSYDYGAPIAEDGNATDLYYSYKY